MKLIFEDMFTHTKTTLYPDDFGTWFGDTSIHTHYYEPAGFYLHNEAANLLRRDTIYFVTAIEITAMDSKEFVSGVYKWAPIYNDVTHFERIDPLKACEILEEKSLIGLDNFGDILYNHDEE